MTIQRIGSTEGVKEVYGIKVVPLIGLVVVHNGIVSTCGVTAEPTGDVRVQTKKVLETIDRLLQQAGTDKSKLLTANVWLAVVVKLSRGTPTELFHTNRRNCLILKRHFT